uniref:Protein LURP-one-related 5 n=1 Tax=Anthurium amnicola TaxID=1678845 RepID=A0A1D1Z8P6_9ARAE
MSRIHPSERKQTQKKRAPVAKGAVRPSAWTVWKKSSMAFQGTDGFSVFDSEGRLAFRVDNYSRRSKCVAGDVVLMDAAGRALLTLRPQIMSMHDQWNCVEGDGGTKHTPTNPVFSMRKRSIFQNGDEAVVFMGGAKLPAAPSYRIDGCFWGRCCRIRLGGTGEVVAEITRKMATASVSLSDDVFCLLVQPSVVDVELVMAIVVVMDRICKKPHVTLMCS